MNYTSPEGCRAAVSSNWEYDHGTYRLTARMVCGERNNIVDGSFNRQFLDLNTRNNQDKTEEIVSSDVTAALGAMCLGCPHNSRISEGTFKAE